MIEDGGYHDIFPFMVVKRISGKKTIVSLPFSDYCNPLINNSANLQDFLTNILSYLKERKYSNIEFRTTFKFCDKLVFSEEEYIHKLFLDSPEILQKPFSHSVKNSISKSERSGVKVIFNNSSASLNEFYNLQCLSRKRHNLPPQPFKFFKNLTDIIFNNSMGDIALAYYNNQAIAGGLFLKFGKKVLFKYANSDFNYQNLRPNNLLVWEALKKYSGEDFQEFDFGKTEAGNIGLKKFKEGFNTFSLNLYRFTISVQDGTQHLPSKSSVKLSRYLFKHAPVSHLQFVGKYIYRYFG